MEIGKKCIGSNIYSLHGDSTHAQSMKKLQNEPSLVGVELDKGRKKKIEGGRRRPLPLAAQGQFFEKWRTVADFGKEF